MLNHVTLMGRLTRDPELRLTDNQNYVVNFTLAVGRDGKDKETDFIDCVAWRKTAEFAAKYFRKGSMAVVEGRLQIRVWEDKEGTKRRSAEVVVSNLHFGESKKPQSPDVTASSLDLIDFDGELPF